MLSSWKWHDVVISVRAKGHVFEHAELVAHPRRLLEFEVACVFEHLLFQTFDFAGYFLLCLLYTSDAADE